MVDNHSWVHITVDNDGLVLLEGGSVPIPVDGVFTPPQGQNVIYSLRHTPRAGRHIVAMSRDGAFKYSTRCNKPGTYCLGPEYGYRRIPDEEEGCPIRAALRRHGLSPTIVQTVPPETPVPVTVSSEEVPAAGRQSRFVSDGTATKMGGRFGLDDYMVTGYGFVIVIKSERSSVAAPFSWLQKVYVSRDITDEQLQEAAEQIEMLMQENKGNKQKGMNMSPEVSIDPSIPEDIAEEIRAEAARMAGAAIQIQAGKETSAPCEFVTIDGGRPVLDDAPPDLTDVQFETVPMGDAEVK